MYYTLFAGGMPLQGFTYRQVVETILKTMPYPPNRPIYVATCDIVKVSLETPRDYLNDIYKAMLSFIESMLKFWPSRAEFIMLRESLTKVMAGESTRNNLAPQRVLEKLTSSPEPSCGDPTHSQSN